MSRRRVTGRMAGLMYLASGGLTLAVGLLENTPELRRGPLVGLSILAILLGAVSVFLPWERWPWWASLGTVVLSMALLGVANHFGAARYSGVFFVMIFAWIGVGYGRWISFWLVPVATAAYVIPLLTEHRYAAADATWVAVTIPLCLLVGESMGMIADRLRALQRTLIEREQRYSEAFERERQASERLRELDRMKNTFLQAVSHELRTPLTAILGCSLTLSHDLGLSPEEKRDLARRTAANARKLDRLLSDLLDLDKLQRGILDPQRRPTDLAGAVRRLVEDSETFGRRRVVVDAEPVTANVDGPKFERIVENLLANALRHTPVESTVWVRIRRVPDGVLLAVDDDGPGVPDEFKDAVFRPFQRGPAATPHAPGTGIGLTLVARFAELHGGRTWVEDRPGGGASFRVVLPDEDPDARGSEQLERDGTVPASTGAR